MEAVEKLLDAFVNERVVGDVVLPILELRCGGQFTVQKQVSRLKVGRFLGEFLDRVTAVAQNTLVAVDESDAADAGSGVVVSGVVADHPEIVGVYLNLPQVHGLDGVVGDGKLVGLARAIVNDGQGVAARGFRFGSLSLRSRSSRVHTNHLT